jgi:hypothetical protein
LGTNIPKQYSLVEASHKKWQESENDLNDNQYELPILRYDANQDALVEQKKRTPIEEPKNTITIDIWRRRKLKWRMSWVKQPNQCYIEALRGRMFTIICPWLQAHTQMKIVGKIVNIPFFKRIWKCPRKKHDIVDKKKQESIEVVLQYWLFIGGNN